MPPLPDPSVTPAAVAADAPPPAAPRSPADAAASAEPAKAQDRRLVDRLAAPPERDESPLASAPVS